MSQPTAPPHNTDTSNYIKMSITFILFYFLLALQPPLGVVFYGPLVGFSLLAYEVS